ncbi:hypothetical protein BDB01DRAFT_903534 [Pilobolus umbonatus]|nr:hypothetical protein BDB01DRAFT_903534 [Pilobolus umbonatus]
MMAASQIIEPLPPTEEINEEDLIHIIYGLPIDPRKNRIMLIASAKSEDKKWSVPKYNIDEDDIPEVEIMKVTYDKAGIQGQVIGIVGAYYECGKSGKLKAHVKVYEIQIDELIRKWPSKKKKERRWFNLEEAMKVLEHKPFLQHAIQASSMVLGIQARK